MSFGKAADLVNLAMLAAGRTGVTLSDIELEFGCVRRTAQRMVAALERSFPATESYRGYDGRWYWRLPSRTLAPLLTPSSAELAALATARDQLMQSGLEEEADLIRSIRDKVRAMIPDDQSARIATDEEALLEALGYATKPGPQTTLDPVIRSTIAEALKGRCRLSIVYRSRGDEAASTRMIEPLGLLLGARQYLVAIDTAKRDGRYRHYRVEDITAAEFVPEGFAPPDDFDLETYARRAFGSFHDDREYGPTMWRFAAHAADRVRRYSFHPDQVVKERGDGSIEVTFSASGHLEMAWHLYSWGDAVEVVEPAELAELVNRYRRPDFPALP